MNAKSRIVAVFLLAWPGFVFAQAQEDPSLAGSDAASGLSAPTQLETLNVPLSGAGLLMTGALSSDAINLPPSALDAARPAPAALPPQKLPLQAAGSQAASVSLAPAPAPAPRTKQEEPFFAQTLSRLGLDPVLASRLGEIQSDPAAGSNPKVPTQTPDLVAAIVQGPAGESLSAREKIALIAAALAISRPGLESRHAYLLSELRAQTGVAPSDLAALASAAGFGSQSRDAAASLKPWMFQWGRRLGFAAKTAGAADAASRPTSPAALANARATLGDLRSNSDFAVLPPVVRRNFLAVLNESARAQAPPAFAPAQAQALVQARGEADSLGLAADSQAEPTTARTQTSAALAGLNNAGFAVLSPESIPDFFLEGRVLKAVEKSRADAQSGGFWQWEFMDEGGTWRVTKTQTPELVADVRAFSEALTRELRAALPGESIAMRDVQIRVNPPPETAVALHVDGGYITATCALAGPGTVIYDDSQGGRPRRIDAPAGSVAFVSNLDREFARKIPGAIHSAPRAAAAGRVVLIIRYKSLGQAPAPREQRLRQQEANARRIKAVEKTLK